MMNRWWFLISILVMIMRPVFAQEVAITMDNPQVEPSPLFSPEARDKAILGILSREHIKIILFVQGAQVDNKAGRALLARWNQAGQLLGNHTYSHDSLAEVDEDKFAFDALSNEMILNRYSQFRRIFRFPYLKEGKTPEQRDTFRRFLLSHGYENGSVTIDASDWYVSKRLEEKLRHDPATDLKPYRRYYLDHIWDRAQYYDGLAKSVLGRSPRHVLLIHHNLLNALFLGDLIRMFGQHGWRVIDAEEAYRDPVFRLSPNVIPAGESLIWSLAKETGRYDKQLRYPGEDESYEKGKMDALGL